MIGQSNDFAVYGGVIVQQSLLNISLKITTKKVMRIGYSTLAFTLLLTCVPQVSIGQSAAQNSSQKLLLEQALRLFRACGRGQARLRHIRHLFASLFELRLLPAARA